MTVIKVQNFKWAKVKKLVSLTIHNKLILEINLGVGGKFHITASK